MDWSKNPEASVLTDYFVAALNFFVFWKKNFQERRGNDKNITNYYMGWRGGGWVFGAGELYFHPRIEIFLALALH